MPGDHALIQREHTDMPATKASRIYNTKSNAIEDHNDDGNIDADNNTENIENNDNDNIKNFNENNKNGHNHSNSNKNIYSDLEDMITDDETNNEISNKNKTKNSRKSVNDKTFIISRSTPATNRETRTVNEHKAPPPVASRPKLRKKSKSTLTPKTQRNKNNPKLSSSFDQSSVSVAPARIPNDQTYVCEIDLAQPALNSNNDSNENMDTFDPYTLQLKEVHEALTPRRVKNNTNTKKKKSNSNENTPRQLKKARILKKTSALLKTLETSPYLQGPIRKPSDLSVAALARIKKP